MLRRVATALPMLLAAVSAHAAAPRAVPHDVKRFAANGRYFFVSRQAQHSTIVFSAARPASPLWSVPAWLPLADVSNDGNHLAAIYPGGNILAADAVASTPLLTFYNRSAPARTFTVGDVVPDLTTLRRSDAGRVWGYVVGFRADGCYVVMRDGEVKPLVLNPAGPHP